MVLGSSTPLHFVIFPWLAFGHLLPCLELAERLASRGHRVSFVSTPRNIARLPPVSPAVSSLIDSVALPFPHVEGLPEGAESTNDVPFDKSELLWKPFDGLAAPFREFLGAACHDGNRPDCIIVDGFHHWAAGAALEYKVPCAVLLMGPAYTTATWAPWLSRLQQAAATHEQAAAAAAPRLESEMSVPQRISLTLNRCTLTAIRSCTEWEPETLPHFKTICGKPVVPLGLLPPSPNGGRGRAASNGEDDTQGWLDNQVAKSVVYVALGSEVPLCVEQVHELALGLELAGTRFLWALRKPIGIPDSEILPMGFVERTHSRGLVKMTWVPQTSILEHMAIGAFLTHCGWNSTIEGLLFGHPLIMLPIHADQVPNAQLMEREKVGVQVPRDESNGSFDRNAVARAVRAVMLEEERRRNFATNVWKLQAIAADKECQDSYISRFIEHLRSHSTIAEGV